jgi:hypothetical protein
MKHETWNMKHQHGNHNMQKRSNSDEISRKYQHVTRTSTSNVTKYYITSHYIAWRFTSHKQNARNIWYHALFLLTRDTVYMALMFYDVDEQQRNKNIHICTTTHSSSGILCVLCMVVCDIDSRSCRVGATITYVRWSDSIVKTHWVTSSPARIAPDGMARAATHTNTNTNISTHDTQQQSQTRYQLSIVHVNVHVDVNVSIMSMWMWLNTRLHKWSARVVYAIRCMLRVVVVFGFSLC